MPRPRSASAYLAASMLLLPGSSDKDNNLVKRIAGRRWP